MGRVILIVLLLQGCSTMTQDEMVESFIITVGFVAAAALVP